MTQASIKTPKYSVLMSVYKKEEPNRLRSSMLSIFRQTLPTDDYVLVCDGPLTAELDAVIIEMQNLFGTVLHVRRLNRNMGLGNALNIGLAECRHDIIVRMDSDDISIENRCDLEVGYMTDHPDVDIVSGTILEFCGSTKNITGKRELPQNHEEICIYSKKRNPFNHPAVAFRKKAVLDAGSYNETYHLFEDYYLWIRMLKNGSHGHNLKEPVLYMRTPADIYRRRGGVQYARDMIRFHKWLRKTGWSSRKDYITGAIPHFAVCILPSGMRKIVYRVLHK